MTNQGILDKLRSEHQQSIIFIERGGFYTCYYMDAVITARIVRELLGWSLEVPAFGFHCALWRKYVNAIFEYGNVNSVVLYKQSVNGKAVFANHDDFINQVANKSYPDFLYTPKGE